MSEPSENQRLKYREFANEYVIDYDARAAYERCSCYKAKGASARARSSKLLSNPYVQEYIREASEKKIERLQLSQDIVVTELLRIGLSDMKNYVAWGDERISIKDSDDLTIDESRAIGEIEINSEIELKETEKNPIRKQRVKLKLHNKMTALDNLAKHLGMYVNKSTVDVNHNYGTIQVPSTADPSDWVDIVKQQTGQNNDDDGSAGASG